MRYRKLGKANVDTSVLSFGAMRLPMIGSKSPMDGFNPDIPIDEVEATKMIHHAMEQGINYFDTAYGYHAGKSEVFVGKVLRDHRSKVMIATKLPVWNIEKPQDMEKIFQEQLGRLQTDYVDVYHVHGLSAPMWEKMKKMGVLEFMDGLVRSGRIRFAGFSFHDELKIFKEIVDAYDWSVCQIQYNFYDRDYQAGKAGLDYAAARNIGIVVMEPLRGGKLVDPIPPEIQEIWDSASSKKSPVEWAMRWVYNHPDVSTVLTGASTLAQLKDHTRGVKDAAPNSLTAEELALFDRVCAEYRKMVRVDCTGCGYCMKCPNGVNIPSNFAIYNDAFLFKSVEQSSFMYQNFLPPDERASGCTDCLLCLEKCPQKIDIPKDLKEVEKLLGKK